MCLALLVVVGEVVICRAMASSGFTGDPDMQNMGNRPPIVALGKEGIGRWKNGKGENETWGKGGIRCHILNILVQHGRPC